MTLIYLHIVKTTFSDDWIEVKTEKAGSALIREDLNCTLRLQIKRPSQCSALTLMSGLSSSHPDAEFVTMRAFTSCVVINTSGTIHVI